MNVWIPQSQLCKKGQGTTAHRNHPKLCPMPREPLWVTAQFKRSGISPEMLILYSTDFLQKIHVAFLCRRYMVFIPFASIRYEGSSHAALRLTTLSWVKWPRSICILSHIKCLHEQQNIWILVSYMCVAYVPKNLTYNSVLFPKYTLIQSPQLPSASCCPWQYVLDSWGFPHLPSASA